MRGDNPREIAIRVLRYAKQANDFTETIINNYLINSNLSRLDRSLTREITMGCMRWKFCLEWLAKRKLRDETPEIVIQVICIGLYQLFWMNRIPPHAAINETVQLCRFLHLDKHTKVVNAVLRSYTREMEETENQILPNLSKNYPHIAFSHPKWIYARWCNQFGQENTLKLLKWNNKIPHNFVRCNALKISTVDLLKLFIDQGYEAKICANSWLNFGNTIKLLTPVNPVNLPGFDEGYFYIQDPAALLAPQLLNPLPGESVLDACAAPGGKTTYMAQLMQNKGKITALDIPERLDLIEENCARLGINIVETKSLENFSSKTKFDKILLDVPCSNTGVFRRRIDARYRLSDQELRRLIRLQQEILENYSKHLKSNGVLVYSTCSIDNEEDSTQIKKFVKLHENFKLVEERLILPCEEKTDGAYVAVLQAV